MCYICIFTKLFILLSKSIPWAPPDLVGSLGPPRALGSLRQAILIYPTGWAYPPCCVRACVCLCALVCVRVCAGASFLFGVALVITVTPARSWSPGLWENLFINDEKLTDAPVTCSPSRPVRPSGLGALGENYRALSPALLKAALPGPPKGRPQFP